VDLLQGHVVAARKTIVAIQYDHPQFRIFFFEKGQRIIRGGIVGDDHLTAGTSIGRDKRKKLLEVPASVVIEYDYCDCWRHLVVHREWFVPKFAHSRCTANDG